MVVVDTVRDRVKTRTLDPHAFHKIKSKDIAPFLLSLGQMISLSLSSLHVLLCSPRFRVIVEMVKPERPDLSVTLKGLDYLLKE